MVFCLRYVDDSLQVHEEVIGLHSMETTLAAILLRMDLKMDNCRVSATMVPLTCLEYDRELQQGYPLLSLVHYNYVLSLGGFLYEFCNLINSVKCIFHYFDTF